MLEMGAPTGTVTFLFTDIEGSTRLWDQHPDAMSEAMEIHDVLLDERVADHRGYVFSRAGDGWGISFGSPSQAINAALDIQAGLAATEWPPPIDAIKVRMGIHTGTSVERNGDYFGTTVNRAARVSAVGDGGQVLITDAVHLLVVDDTHQEWRFHDLGEHRLQDLVRTERIWQLDTVDTPAILADIAHRTVQGNLPPVRTRVFGRDKETTALVERVRSECLVTLVGVGGVGKTTLAQSVARQLAEGFPAGGWFVDLSDVEDPEAVSQAVASDLGISQRKGMTITESILDSLSTERRLIVIDNAEHLVGAVAVLVDSILDHTSDARVIVTSREPLAIDGEVIQRVDPLNISMTDGQSPAAELFVERAKRVAPDLDDTAFDIDTVLQICGRLDGLPLAIELAASQCETMMPSEILRALEDQSLTLRSTSRSTTDRHRSLSDLVAWSYENLDEYDQTVFCRLAVFSGGCTSEAAEAVCADNEHTKEHVTASLRNLARKSMIVIERRDGTTRFTMLETLRTFAEQRFGEASETREVERAHASWFCEMSKSARSGLAGPDESRWLTLLLADLGNVQSASRWAGAHKEFDLMTGIGSSLPALVSSKIRPGMLNFAEDALEALPADHEARLNYAVALAYEMLFAGDMSESPHHFSAMTAELAERAAVDAMHANFDHISRFFRGDLDVILRDGPKAIAAVEDVGGMRMASGIAIDYALALFFGGELERAREVSNTYSSRAMREGNPTVIAWAQYLEGELNAEDDPRTAIDVLEESIESSVSVDNEFVAGISLIVLAATAGRHGEIPVALDAMDRGIHLFRDLGNRPQMWTAMRNLVEILHEMGNSRDAFVLHAAVEADSTHATELFGEFGDRYLAIVEDIGASLGNDAASAQSKGTRLEYNDAVEFALAAIAQAT
jgi:predicted ATPase/class 3 adenylate cyclase